MRAIRYRIPRNTKLLLEEIAHQYNHDTNYILDLFSLFKYKGDGIPSEDRVRKMVKYIASRQKVSETTVSILLKKRVFVLKTVARSPLFTALSARKDTVEAMRTLLVEAEVISNKNRQAQCLTCKYLKECEFGKQYKNSARDISLVIDADYKKKAHADCPFLPELDKANQMAIAMEMISKVVEEEEKEQSAASGATESLDAEEMEQLREAQACAAEADLDEDTETGSQAGGGSGSLDPAEEGIAMPAKAFRACNGSPQGPHSARFNGNNYVLIDRLVSGLTAANLTLWNIGRKFSLALEAQKRGKFRPVQHIADSSQGVKMKSLSDLTKLESHQHALPDEIFEGKLAQKKLLKREEQEHHDKKQLLYLLIDSSFSMSGQFGTGNALALFSRSALAVTLSTAIVRRVRDDGGIVFCRFFDTGQTKLLAAKDKNGYSELLNLIVLSSYNGGGTSIVPALRCAASDIEKANKTEELAKAEILLISDNEDTFDTAKAKAAIGEVTLNALDVSGSEFRNQGASGALKSVCAAYYKADEAALDVNELVKLV